MLTMARRPLGAEMEKPKNRWAIGLWIIASLFAVGQITEINLINCKPATSWHVRNLVDRAIPLCPRFIAIFASLSVLIEMTDQIRWQLRSLAERVKAVENAKL